MSKVALYVINYRDAEEGKKCPWCYQYNKGACEYANGEPTFPGKCCSLFILNSKLEICKNCGKPLVDHVDGLCVTGRKFVDMQQLDLF
jgi:hypothetical protein